MINGIVNVYKEQGYTSHDVVAKLRGILKQKKIGHTGTLDPGAEGVLPICLGNATKVCDLLTDEDKVYETVLLLGMTTDTQDIFGKVQSSCKPELTEAQIVDAVQSFVGFYEQIPPMYSAKKVEGRKLYELAREGKEVERQPHRVQIFEIQIGQMEWKEDKIRVKLTVHCSKGTYIRTLCQDIGERLGVGGCMERLVRRRVGRFTVEESLTLEQIEEKVQNGTFPSAVLPVDTLFANDYRVDVTSEGEHLLYNGNPLPLSAVTGFDARIGQEETRVRVYDTQGCFKALYVYSRPQGQLRPVKMFL